MDGLQSRYCEVKMKTRLNRGSVLGILSSVAMLVLICTPVYGQWVRVPTGGIPKRPDGKPNLSAPAPRSPDGHPDLSGVWESGGPKYILDIAADLKPGDVPFMPWAKALVDQRADGSHSGEVPPASGMATPWSLTHAVSMERHGWIRRASPRPMRCTSSNVSGERTSGTWK